MGCFFTTQRRMAMFTKRPTGGPGPKPRFAGAKSAPGPGPSGHKKDEKTAEAKDNLLEIKVSNEAIKLATLKREFYGILTTYGYDTNPQVQKTDVKSHKTDLETKKSDSKNSKSGADTKKSDLKSGLDSRTYWEKAANKLTVHSEEGRERLKLFLDFYRTETSGSDKQKFLEGLHETLEKDLNTRNGTYSVLVGKITNFLIRNITPHSLLNRRTSQSAGTMEGIELQVRNAGDNLKRRRDAEEIARLRQAAPAAAAAAAATPPAGPRQK